ncbi:MAG: hypothetical protein QY307_03000 [Acidimicrobiia bacterium]|nr:MAG: hypothetical protein QY307_03000 [Acidimicrobiia bacterium]
MSEPRRIRVIGQQRKEPDLKALARAVIELARLLDQESGDKPNTKREIDE